MGAHDSMAADGLAEYTQPSPSGPSSAVAEDGRKPSGISSISTQALRLLMPQPVLLQVVELNPGVMDSCARECHDVPAEASRSSLPQICGAVGDPGQRGVADQWPGRELLLVPGKSGDPGSDSAAEGRHCCRSDRAVHPGRRTSDGMDP